MIKSFTEHLYENRDELNDLILKLSSSFIFCCENTKTDGEYRRINGIHIEDPYTFDAEFIIKKESDPNFKEDEHFHKLSWEELNFDQYGFAIDARMKIDKKDTLVPKIIVICIIDPDREPECYQELQYRLTDIFAHEINHLDQVGWNRKPFNTRPTSGLERQSAKQSHLYFKLQDEVESMVEGMYTRSKKQNVAIDSVFMKYLNPFIKSKKISVDECLEVLNIWIKYTLENFPDSKFSNNEKIRSIINSI